MFHSLFNSIPIKQKSNIKYYCTPGELPRCSRLHCRTTNKPAEPLIQNIALLVCEKENWKEEKSAFNILFFFILFVFQLAFCCMISFFSFVGFERETCKGKQIIVCKRFLLCLFDFYLMIWGECKGC